MVCHSLIRVYAVIFLIGRQSRMPITPKISLNIAGRYAMPSPAESSAPSSTTGVMLPAAHGYRRCEHRAIYLKIGDKYDNIRAAQFLKKP